MFESLSSRLQDIFSSLRSRGKLTEQDIELALKEVKLSLLEADVNFKVVRDFTKDVKAKAIGANVLESLTPSQQVIKIVHDELVGMLGGAPREINLLKDRFNTVMVAGLQGSGKTTTCAKIARFYQKKGFRPLLCAMDIYRPAAITQLELLGKQLGIEVFTVAGAKPPEIAVKAVKHAQDKSCNLLIMDTAGRLHVDEPLMHELMEIRRNVEINEILLVLDAMTGQDAVNAATIFNDQIEVSGIVLTKLDGDARGGAALSVAKVTGKPVVFVGVGEKIEEFDLFYPDRMAGRIMGMGDILSLIEKAQLAFDEKEARAMEEKIRKLEFNLEDFLSQLAQIKKMGPFSQLMEMIPGFNKLKGMDDVKLDDKPMKKIEAIIQSMTKEERYNPKILEGSRKKRIASGSGTTVQDVNQLLKQFDQMRKMMKQMNVMEKKFKGKNLPFMKNLIK
ncbi:MAG: signal recognition particle protein [Candidatus Wallbacteria bacterium]|nr:signal recognition particle protein [Candidatus Wallbacteria bacterium]